MPFIDMPLSELMTYQGSSPLPDDFDNYWQTAMDEMINVKPEMKLQLASMQFPGTTCYDMTFTGVRGSRIYAKYLRPAKTNDPVPAVILFHGYSDQSGDWFDKLSFVSAGYAVFAMDCRGQAGRSNDMGSVLGTTLRGHIIRGLDDNAENLLFRQIFLDSAQLAGLVMNMDGIDISRVSVSGGSQGGALATVLAALEPRIYRAAIRFPFLSDYRRVWEMDLAKNAYEELSYYFRRIDPLHLREKEVFNRLGYIDVQNFASKIKANVLFIATLIDEVCPPSTQFAVYNKILSPKQLLVYPDYAHETPPGCMDQIMLFLTE